jgi:D-lyxose ketol-isomerase
MPRGYDLPDEYKDAISMLTQNEIEKHQKQALVMFHKAGIYVSDEESESIEIADFGLGDFERTGLGVLVYVNTDRCCAKELAIWPGQTCPEHWHPPVGDNPGKEETFRCRWGRMYLYVSGDPTPHPDVPPPAGRESTYTVSKQIILNQGDQYTLQPGVPHWFQAGSEGAVVSEFSTRSTDEYDRFSDTEINRFTQIVGDE